MNKYTVSQAKITADNGNEMKADVMQLGGEVWETLDNVYQALKVDFEELNREILDYDYGYSQDNKIEALAKLGQLAATLKAVQDARSAANAVRCW
jgi:hypothetical protein